jgi:hypothetical protein
MSDEQVLEIYDMLRDQAADGKHSGRQFASPATRKTSQTKTHAFRPSQVAKATASGLAALGANVAISNKPMPIAIRAYSIALEYGSTNRSGNFTAAPPKPP